VGGRKSPIVPVPPLPCIYFKRSGSDEDEWEQGIDELRPAQHRNRNVNGNCACMYSMSDYQMNLLGLIGKTYEPDRMTVDIFDITQCEHYGFLN
jgi:hypothetical protein